MDEITAYNVKTRNKTTIKNPVLVSLKNGRQALKGVAADDGKTMLFRIISAADAKKIKSSK
jgi:hypothetical protein